MSNKQTLPERAARIPDEAAAEIVRLDLRNLPKAQIARRLNVSRQTVSRVLARTKAAIALTHDVEEERERSLAVYSEVLREAWQGVEDARRAGKSPAALLAEIRLTQSRIDNLLGISPVPGRDDPAAKFSNFRAIVLEVIRTKAPDLGPVLSQRLLLAAGAAKDEYDVHGNTDEYLP